MFVAINNSGEYQEYPQAKNKEEAELEMKLHFSKEEIEEYEWEIVEE